MESNRTGKLDQVFVGEGYYNLHLRIGELIVLQEKTGVGPGVLAQRFSAGEWMVQDIRETIRLALIGGGDLDQRDSYSLVKRVIVSGYLQEYAMLAAMILGAALFGASDEPLDDEGGDEPGEALTPAD